MALALHGRWNGRTPGSPTAAGAGRESRAVTVAAVAVLVVVVLLAGSALAWRLSGGSWAVIESPSMGTAAPVGTLILVQHREMADVGVGDVITFRPPSTPDELYTHRVVQRYPDGRVQVRGDINGAPDPLPIADADLVGQVVAALHGVGWLIKALPTLILGVVVLLVATGRYLSTRWRSSVRVLGVCLVVGVAALILHPFVHPVLIAVDPQPGADGRQRASVVSGGLFPTRVTGADGTYVDLRSGQAGVVPVAASKPGGPLLVNGTSNLQGFWLLGVIGAALLPLLWCVTVGLSPDDRLEARGGP